MYRLAVALQEAQSKKKGNKSSVDPSSMAGGSEDALSHEENVVSIDCYSGNPTVEVVYGKLHLYRCPSVEIGSKRQLPRERQAMFIAPFDKSLSHMRTLRDSEAPDHYVALLDFAEQDAADEFFQQFDRQQFNRLEPEECRVLFVKDVALVDTAREPWPNFNATGHVELPSCPVCLERLDPSISGILTIQCNHTFHCACLSKWGDSKCPVCRYCQEPEEKSCCMKCGREDALWICLICGYIGCGRYSEGHAVDHFNETNHTYSMEVDSQRVWDYVGDNYVHRLIQNQADGKVVELPDPRPQAMMPPDEMAEVAGGAGVPSDVENDQLRSKLDYISMEYNYTLTTQLEKQRKYFEERIADIEHEYAVRISHISEELHKEREEKREVESKLVEIEKEKKSLEKSNTKLNAKVNKYTEEVRFLKEVNQSLVSNQADFKQTLSQTEAQSSSKAETQDKKIQELEEQVRDLMFFLEAQKTIEGNADAVGGSVMVAPATPESSQSGKRPTSSRRKKK